MIVLHEPDETDFLPCHPPGLGSFMYVYYSGAASSLYDIWHERLYPFRNCFPTALIAIWRGCPGFCIAEKSLFTHMDILLIFLCTDRMAFVVYSIRGLISQSPYSREKEVWFSIRYPCPHLAWATKSKPD